MTRKELEQAVQMVISEVASEDLKFLEKGASYLSEEFPDGTNIPFLSKRAYFITMWLSRCLQLPTALCLLSWQ
jgi:5'-3' exoribonuclease 1